MNNVKLVLFDLDGVLIESRENMEVSWSAVQSAFGIDIPFEDYFKNIGRPFNDILKLIGVKTKEAESGSNNGLWRAAPQRKRTRAGKGSAQQMYKCVRICVRLSVCRYGLSELLCSFIYVSALLALLLSKSAL